MPEIPMLPAPHDDVCEACGEPITKGEYIIPQEEDGYKYFIHEECPALEAE